MSWYETTSDRSITLCRALIGDNPALLGKFDGVLKSHGFENLTIGAMKPVYTSQEEALRELQWLKEFLTNVVRRTCGLKQEQDIEVEHEHEHEQESGEPPISGSQVIEAQVDELREDKSKNADLSPAPKSSARSRTQKSRVRKSRVDSRVDESRVDESQRRDEPEQQVEDHKAEDHKAENQKVNEEKGIQTARRNGHSESQLPDSRTKPAAQRLKSRQLRRQAIEKRKLSDIKTDQRIKQEKNKRRSRTREEQDNEQWCICRKPSAGLMLACDNSKCPIEWFHAKCVGLKSVPKSWHCPKCANRRRK